MISAMSNQVATAAGNSPTTGQTVQEAQDRFLTLLVTQMQNQDPLNPMDNAQLTTQLAQISTVQGIEKLNDTMLQVMAGFSASQTLDSAAMIGRSVLVPSSQVQLENGAAKFGFEVPGPADRATITMRDANGREVRSWTVSNLTAGQHVVAWDGLDASGNKLADGRYTMSVAAVRGEQSLSSTALASARVASVMRTESGISVTLATGGVYALSDVREIS
jgi:flagellar basal-body rod modification protein FlgD